MQFWKIPKLLPWKGLAFPLGVECFLRMKNLKKCMKLNGVFRGGGGYWKLGRYDYIFWNYTISLQLVFHFLWHDEQARGIAYHWLDDTGYSRPSPPPASSRVWVSSF